MAFVRDSARQLLSPQRSPQVKVGCAASEKGRTRDTGFDISVRLPGHLSFSRPAVTPAHVWRAGCERDHGGPCVDD